MSSLLIAPHPTLRTKAAEVTELTEEIQQTIETLQKTLRESVDPPGVGLAAPQVNARWRIFATQLDQDAHARNPIRILVNPVVLDRADKLILGSNPRRPDLEGCLSIPDLYAPVLRHEWITVQWTTLNWQNELAEEHTETFFDFSARVLQHELDHLDGILFTDHVREQNQPLYQVSGEELEEVSIEIAKDL